ncbi:MAG: methyltransferase regulatory domain-containing protein [Alphaproteobacteria bacterium]|nr:methyltransferase regulatory domain-containing protein [Alphaproteobacteria bacterium]
MYPNSFFSPVSLRYISALHGRVPQKAGNPFTYADASCVNAEDLVCLAASNPEGTFFGFIPDAEEYKEAMLVAEQRGASNITFLPGTPAEIAARLEKEPELLPPLDFLCSNGNAGPLPAAERDALFSLAEKQLVEGGILTTTYKAYSSEDGALRFLIQKLVPEMNAEQKKEFLTEIKKLGVLYFFRHFDMADLLDKAIADEKPEDFFSIFEKTPAESATFETLLAAGSRRFAYGGDADMASNYVELTVPHEAQDIVSACQNSPLYEIVKDFALNRDQRSDIWIKSPCDTSADPAELFGGFAYGLSVPRSDIPATYTAKGKKIDLSSPLYMAVLNLMAIMPIGVGDALVHSSLSGAAPENILEVFQILVACGFAKPMRGVMTEISLKNITSPKLCGNFNLHLDKTLVEKDVLFASEVMGCGIVLSAKDALVLQALNRGGIVGSAKALLPELERLANAPAAPIVLGSGVPSVETATKIIVETMEASLSKWYSLALLEAA